VKKTAEKPASVAKKAVTVPKKAPVAAVKAVPPKAAAPAPKAGKPAAKPVAAPAVPVKAVKAAKAVKTVPVAAPPAPVAKKKQVVAVVAPAPVPVPAAAPVPEAAPAPRRGGRKAASAPQPTPQPTPSHAPDAAKATFSHIPERVMTVPVHSPARKDPKLANNWKNKAVDQLSDEEVLAMPEAEYMNDVQLAFFRLKLVKLKQDILANAGETTEHLREDTVVVPDPADRATIEEEHALELRTRDRERKLLKKIEQSIARIDGGDYGYCDETGEPIGVGRLLARPTASLSLEAQQRRELKQKMFGD
jgi:DnaK suppressor protein